MLVRNEGEGTVAFQALFHTYLAVENVADVGVTGLKGAKYLDKIAGGEAVEGNDVVGFKGEVDRVYLGVGGAVEVKEEATGGVRVEREGLEEVVVWNPGE